MPDPYISEVKYLGGASLDFVEVAVDAGTDVSDIFVTIYNPSGIVRTVNALETLSTTIAGKDVYLISTALSSTFNGLHKNGAVAISQDGALLQFISFDDGSPVTASGGVADGETSTQIGQAGAGESLETVDGGTSYQTQTTPSGGTIPCFLRGTRLATPSGWVDVQDLATGDLVWDATGQTLKVRLLLSRHVSIAEAICSQGLRPVHIAAGALGSGVPERDLYLSRQHRVLVTSKIAQRMFGQPQVLVAAHQLLAATGITEAPITRSFDYYHVVLEQHGVVIAEGAACESFLIAQESMQSISAQSRIQVREAFPEARVPGYTSPSAAFIPKSPRQRKLVARHVKNNKAFTRQVSVHTPMTAPMAEKKNAQTANGSLRKVSKGQTVAN